MARLSPLAQRTIVVFWGNVAVEYHYSVLFYLIFFYLGNMSLAIDGFVPRCLSWRYIHRTTC